MSRFVSIVIATYNRCALLARTLDALAGQRWPRDGFEVVVADNGSTDGTDTMLASRAARNSGPALRYLRVGQPGKSNAVNAALAIARGDILLFTDDDVVAEPLWIERMVGALDDTGADFAAGRIVPQWETPPPRWLSPSLYGVLAIPDNGAKRVAISRDANHIMPIGASMALRRSVVDRIGGLRADLGKLDGTLRTGEDHELFLRMLHAGYRGVYEPDAVVHHWVPRSRLDRRYFRQWLYQNGQDVARLERVYAPATPRLLGGPRYLWRQGLVDAARAVRAAIAFDEPARVASALRVVWFAGYLRAAARRRERSAGAGRYGIAASEDAASAGARHNSSRTQLTGSR